MPEISVQHQCASPDKLELAEFFGTPEAVETFRKVYMIVS